MPSVLLVSDFDGTLTKKDTTYLSFRSTGKFQKASKNERKQLLEEFKTIGEVYMSGYKTLVECLLEEYKMDTSSSPDKLGQFLSTIDHFNLDSRCSLAKQKYFEDFVYGNLDELIKEIEFYPHAIETLENLQKLDNIHCKILSVNWFPELLQACMEGVISKDDVITSTVPIIRGHQLDFGKVSTAHGKGEWLRKWNKEYCSLSVYLGDSLTDLPALLEANYGVIFGSDEKIIEVTDVFCIDVVPLLLLLNESDNNNTSIINCNSNNNSSSSSSSSSSNISNHNNNGNNNNNNNSGNRKNNNTNNFDRRKKCLYLTTSWQEIETLVIGLL